MAGKREREPREGAPATPEEMLELVRELAREFREIDERRGRLRDELGQAITRARSSGYSWVDIARASEFLAPGSAQQWARPLPGMKPTSSAGVSASVAAEALGVTRKTVYAWVESGRLEATRDPSGRLRIILPSSGGSQPPQEPAGS